MSDISKLHIGEQISNDELCDIFKCAPQGGMRRSLTTNTLVIVSNHLKSIYEDRWLDNCFHYTGMGQVGNQDINNAQNKTLAESATNGVDIHLFEVFEDKKYTYQGLVILADSPYQEIQPDAEGNNRSVWVFPLKLKDATQILVLPKEILDKKNKELETKARKKTTEELMKSIKNAPIKAGARNVVAKQYDRNARVAELVRRRAQGKCELCDKQAPFVKTDGEPFLEVHHITWLSNGGSDTIDNAVSLCPNCHRKMHILDLKTDTDSLKQKAIAPIELH
jgi:5-methylcytosine-specific restriction enzyme A